MAPKGVLIVDDNHLARKGVRTLLKSDPEINGQKETGGIIGPHLLQIGALGLGAVILIKLWSRVTGKRRSCAYPRSGFVFLAEPLLGFSHCLGLVRLLLDKFIVLGLVSWRTSIT